MKEIIVQPGQSMLDVIIQATGSLEAGMRFCLDNNVSITDIPASGTTYIISAAALALGDAGELTYMQQNGILLGTLGGTGLPPVLGFMDEGGADEFVSEDGGSVFISE